MGQYFVELLGWCLPVQCSANLAGAATLAHRPLKSCGIMDLDAGPKVYAGLGCSFVGQLQV